MYTPKTDCVEVNLDAQIHVSFNCQKCNATVLILIILPGLHEMNHDYIPNWITTLVAYKGMLIC